MRRRDFVRLLGGATAAPALWPLAARTQPKFPVVGLLGGSSADESMHVTNALREGLSDAGFVEGRTVAFEYRWAHGNDDRLPPLATELVQRPVSVIVTTGAEPSALAAKVATNKIPIVFVINGDPVSIGLVASLNRPGGNLTGISLIASSLEAKRLELLRELVPKTPLIAVLVNPDYPDTDFQIGGVETAASDSGQKVTVLNARTEADIEAAFTAMVQQKAGALLVAADALFNRLHQKIVVLAARYKMPAIYESREFVTASGMASYGASIAGAYKSAGAYVGKILKGAMPADLPVQLPTMFEFVVNLKTAKAIGLEIAPTLLARADEVIE
jgi:putative ABC transport system substrate-binding protein